MQDTTEKLRRVREREATKKWMERLYVQVREKNDRRP